jgi:cysteine synthase A
MGRIYEDTSKTIGNRPLVRVNKLTKGLETSVVAKVQSFNPFSGINDRIPVLIIDAAEKERRSKGGKRTIIEPARAIRALP